MSMVAAETAPGTDRLICLLVSQAAGEDPIATAPAYDGFLVLELGPPWPSDLWKSTLIPPSLPPLVTVLRGRDVVIKAVTVQPDDVYSQPGTARVMFYRRTSEVVANYTRSEYALPEALLEPLLTSLLEGDNNLPSFARYLVTDAAGRDMLVCTHATIDAACGKFGFPLYRGLRDQAPTRADGVRVWRCSMIGGHRFAPTLLDLPSARYWGHLDADAALAILRHSGRVADVRMNYRGWCAARSPYEQVAEREVLCREGWRYLEAPKTMALLGVNAAGEADVAVAVHGPNGDLDRGYEVRVVPRAPIISQHHSGPPAPEPFPQYAAAEIHERSGMEIEGMLVQTDRAGIQGFRDALGKLVVHHEH